MERIYAAVDIGSHTIRSLIASVNEEAGSVRPIDHKRDFSRFALTTDYRNGALRLDENSLNRTLSIIEDYGKYFKVLKVKKVLCGATGVVRKAQNGDVLLDKIRTRFGFPCFIASEEEEALWSTIGALQLLNTTGKVGKDRSIFSSRVLFFDLGGSSTETVFLDRGTIKWWKSFFIGAGSLTRDYIPSAPAHPAWIKEAHNHAKRFFTGLWDPFAFFSPEFVVGAGGTMATLGAIRIGMKEYKPYRVCGVELTSSWIDELISHLASLSLDERRAIPGLEEGREDVIIGGAIIVSALSALARKNQLIVTDGGFLEGLLIKAILQERYSDTLDKPDLKGVFLHSLTWDIEKR
ncbi:MAG: hypothetical protein N2260_00510 [Syntrophobacterales bacterium]|nr:hypothetical protein [Syntrophobacterales bacterium]